MLIFKRDAEPLLPSSIDEAGAKSSTRVCPKVGDMSRLRARYSRGHASPRRLRIGPAWVASSGLRYWARTLPQAQWHDAIDEGMRSSALAWLL